MEFQKEKKNSNLIWLDYELAHKILEQVGTISS